MKVGRQLARSAVESAMADNQPSVGENSADRSRRDRSREEPGEPSPHIDETGTAAERGGREGRDDKPRNRRGDSSPWLGGG
jgi:hypothetical protein